MFNFLLLIVFGNFLLPFDVVPSVFFIFIVNFWFDFSSYPWAVPNLLKLIFLRLTTIVSYAISFSPPRTFSSFYSSKRLWVEFSTRSVMEAFTDYFSKWFTSNSVSARSLALAACLLELNFAFWNEVKLTMELNC
jgi:hypothetical protein